MIRVQSMQPFAEGDIFLGCTLLDNPDDDHAGIGRILQFDKHLNLRGVLWTEGTTHLVGGLAVDPNGVLWAFDNHAVLHVNPKAGRQMPIADTFLPRFYRSASFAKDGSIYLGEHLCAKDPPPGIEKMTTNTFRHIPGESVLGFGYIYKYKPDWTLDRVFKSETAPEFTGFKGVTHSTLHPSEAFITYTTETSKRIMRYDVVNDRQMPDLVTYPGDMMDGNWVIALRYLPDGRLIATRGETYDIIDEDGTTLATHTLGPLNWSDIALCHDGAHMLVSSIFNGTVLKVHVDSGKIVGRIVTGLVKPRRSLAGVAEYPGLPLLA